MELKNRNCILLVCIPIIIFVARIPSLHANYAKFDEIVEKRAESSLVAALQAYKPDPVAVTSEFTKEVEESIKGVKNGGRRELAEGQCLSTNPIDSCWRCDPKWAANRKKLADCAKGFGHGTTGGKDGKFYIVTDPSDDNVVDPKPGTLRHAVIQEEPLWIIFRNSMTIKLSQELIFNSNKTIDGRGKEVRVAYGAGFTIQFVQNVIIHGIRIHDIKPASGGMIRDSLDHLGIRTTSDGDAISMFGSSNIWIDHVSLARCSDGLIDAIMASTAITISNCKFNHHNDVMLLGGSDGYGEDSIMQVTVAFNRFGRGCVQRMPRCRYGFAHIVNNDYSQWKKYAIGGSAQPTIVSQGNRFKASDDINLKEVTHRDYSEESEWKNWQWTSEGDLFLNGAFFVPSGSPLKQTPFSKNTTLEYKPGSFVGTLTRYAGALSCSIKQAC
ncbi:lyase [Lithospermum erythrorhizon]|uniref:Pectate lyase n=1 Tax=Lithospermum erythrorhizon TaxID=34254 RepID=A0AAV3RE05_LITER